MADLHGQDRDRGSDGRELRGDDGGEIRWFRYVRHEDRTAYEAQGWIFAADLGPVHGFYAVLMEVSQDHGPCGQRVELQIERLEAAEAALATLREMKAVNQAGQA